MCQTAGGGKDGCMSLSFCWILFVLCLLNSITQCGNIYFHCKPCCHTVVVLVILLDFVRIIAAVSLSVVISIFTVSPVVTLLLLLSLSFCWILFVL